MKMDDETRRDLAESCPDCGLDLYPWGHGDLQADVRCLGRANDRLRADLSAMTAERDRLRKLFDDAGGSEHNVLALVELYQARLIAADDVAAELCACARELGDELKSALARIAELEAPPVVPRDYIVCKVDHEVDRGEYESRWELWEAPVDPEHGPFVLARMLPSGFFPVSDPGEGIDPAAVRALLWADERDTMPPHEADNDKEVECG